MARRRPAAFTVVSLLAAALFLWLFRTLLVAPEEIGVSFGLGTSEALSIIGRRASVLMLGFAVLLVAARNAPPSPVRRAISLALAVTFAGFATMGLYELWRGVARPDVWVVVGIEVAFAAAFLAVWGLELRAARAEKPGPPELTSTDPAP